MASRSAVSSSFWSPILWIGLNLADAALTIGAIQAGVAREISPVWVGFTGPELVPIKFLGAITVLLILNRVKNLSLLRYLNIGMGLVVGWNIGVLIVGGLAA